MSDQDRALFLVVTIKPRLDRRDEAESQLQSMRRDSVQEAGCVFMHFVQPHDDPDTWRYARLVAAWGRRYYQSEAAAMDELLAELASPPVSRSFDVV